MRPWHTRKIYSGIISSSEKGLRALEGRPYGIPVLGALKATHICVATTQADEYAPQKLKAQEAEEFIKAWEWHQNNIENTYFGSF